MSSAKSPLFWLPQVLIMASVLAAGVGWTLEAEMGSSLLRRGDHHRRHMEYAAALRDYAQAAKLEPTDARPHQRTGSIYLAQGRLEEAEDSLRRALALNTAEVGALTDLGQVMFRTGRREAAIALWERAVASSAGAAEAQHALGMVALEAGAFGQARDRLVRTLEIAPTRVESRYRLALLAARERPGEAEAILLELLQDPLSPEQEKRARSFLEALRGLDELPDSISRSMALGAAYLRADALSLAHDRFRWALSRDPNSLDAQAHVGYVLFRERKRGEAVRDLRHVLSLDPDHALANYYLGLVLLSWGNTEGAMAQFRAVLRADPDNAAAFVEMGRAYYHRRKYAEAAEMFERGARLASGDAGFHLILARFYVDHLWLVEEKGLPEAAWAANIAPENAEAQDVLGWANYLTERYREAEAALERAVDIDPSLASAHYHRGMTLLQMGRREEAASAFRKAVDLDDEGFYRHRAANELDELGEEPL